MIETLSDMDGYAQILIKQHEDTNFEIADIIKDLQSKIEHQNFLMKEMISLFKKQQDWLSQVVEMV